MSSTDTVHGKMESTVNVKPLPPPPAGFHGSDKVKGRGWSVDVSNKTGYLCHLSLEATWDMPPSVLFSIFTYPDNSSLFRDITRVGSRKVVQASPGYKVVQVEQVSHLKVLWISRQYSTWLEVQEDARDPNRLVTVFSLLRSDVLGRFNGRWDLYPVVDASTGQVVGTRGVLQQDILPKGVPSFMAHLPILGGALRGVTSRAITRLMEDINAAVDKVHAGMSKGESPEAVLRRLCGVYSEEMHTNGHVTSHSFDVDADSSEDEDSAEGGEQAYKYRAKDIDAAGSVGTGLLRVSLKVEEQGAEEAAVKLHLHYL